MRAETLLKCARKAHGEGWLIDQGRVVRVGPVNHRVGLVEFEYNDSDVLALQIALEKEGWQFWWWNDEFHASQYEVADPVVLTSNTKPGVLSKCVEAGQ